jgi:uncharacterized protein (TIGR03083 family)
MVCSGMGRNLGEHPERPQLRLQAVGWAANEQNPTMDAARHLDILRREGALVAALAPDHLDLPVPTLEDWTVERVIRHLGKVHRWVAGALRLEPGQGMDEVGPLAPLPRGPECIAGYREALDDVVMEFARRDADEPAPTFVGAGTVGWWLRRQAQEVAVHRVDAQDAVHAAGGPAPDALAADGAADGIDEWARVFLGLRFGQRGGQVPEDLHGRTVHIHGTDDPPPADGAEWLLRFGPDGTTVDATHAKGDVALRGPASDLLLVLWRRRPLDAVDIVGERSVAERLVEVARF